MEEHLRQLGYDNHEFVIIDPQVVAECEKYPGHKNNTFKIFNRKIAKNYEKGSKVAKIEWLEKNQIDFGSTNNVEQIEVEAKTVDPKENVPEEIKEIAKASDNVEIVSVPKDEPKEQTKCAICSTTESHRYVDTTDGRNICASCEAGIFNERVKRLADEGLHFSKDQENTLEDNEYGFEMELDPQQIGKMSEEEFRKIFSTIRAKYSVAKSSANKAEESKEEEKDEKPVDHSELHKARLKKEGFYIAGPTWNNSTDTNVRIPTSCIGTDEFDAELQKALKKLNKDSDKKKEEEKPEPKKVEKKEEAKEEPKKEVKKTSTKKAPAKKASAKKDEESIPEPRVPALRPENVLSQLEVVQQVQSACNAFITLQVALSKLKQVISEDASDKTKLIIIKDILSEIE